MRIAILGCLEFGQGWRGNSKIESEACLMSRFCKRNLILLQIKTMELCFDDFNSDENFYYPGFQGFLPKVFSDMILEFLRKTLRDDFLHSKFRRILSIFQ